MAWLTSQRKRQARFNLQLKLKNPLSSILFHLHYRYTTINKITWCIFSLIQNHQPGLEQRKTARHKATQMHTPKVQQEKVMPPHHTAVVSKNHFLCYKAWQLLPTYFLFCREGRMSQTRPVQLPVPSPYHLICHVQSFRITTTVASATSASTATDTSKENLGFKLTNTSYCKCCINLPLNSLTTGENSDVPVYKTCLPN